MAVSIGFFLFCLMSEDAREKYIIGTSEIKAAFLVLIWIGQSQIVQ